MDLSVLWYALERGHMINPIFAEYIKLIYKYWQGMQLFRERLWTHSAKQLWKFVLFASLQPNSYQKKAGLFVNTLTGLKAKKKQFLSQHFSSVFIVLLSVFFRTICGQLLSTSRWNQYAAMFLTHYPHFWYGHLNDKRPLKYKLCLQKFTDHEISTFHSLQVESDDTVSIPVMTSPNMKGIYKRTEIDTPEKLMLLKSQANKVFQVC